MVTPKTLDFADDPQVTNLRYSRLQVCATSACNTVNRHDAALYGRRDACLHNYFGFFAFGVGAPAGDIAPAVGAAAGTGAVGAAIIGGAPGPGGLAGKLAAPGAGLGRSGGFNERNCLIASPAQIVSMRSSRVPSVCGPGIRYFVRISSQTRRASSIRFFAFNNGTSEISASGPL